MIRQKPDGTLCKNPSRALLSGHASLHQSRARNQRGATSALPIVRPRETVGAGRDATKRAATERKDETEPCHLPDSTQAPLPLPGATTSIASSKPLALPADRSQQKAATEAKEETKKEARDAKMPAREPDPHAPRQSLVYRGRECLSVPRCAGWRSAGCWSFRSSVAWSASLADEISWFGDSAARREGAEPAGRVVHEISWFGAGVGVRPQGLFMSSMAVYDCTSSMARAGVMAPVAVGATAAWRQPSRRLFVAVERENLGACRARSHAQAPRVPRQVPAARQDGSSTRTTAATGRGDDHDPVDFEHTSAATGPPFRKYAVHVGKAWRRLLGVARAQVRRRPAALFQSMQEEAMRIRPPMRPPER